MIVLTLACAIGIYFGLYYGFLVLVPLTLGAMLTPGAVAACQGHPLPAALLAAIVPAIAIQGGYMIGLTSRDLLGQFISRRRAAAPSRGL